MLISEAFEIYTFEEIKLKNGAEKTIKNYNSALSSLLTATADIPIELLNHQTIVRWKMEMNRQGIQPSTMSSYLGKIRMVLKYLRRHNYQVIDERDIDLPQVVIKEAVWLETEEIRQMLSTCTNLRDKALIMALFSSGGRISEVLSLDRDQIRDNKAQVLSKGSKLITLYFDPKACLAIDEYVETRKDKIPCLFMSGQYRRMTVSRAEQIVHKIAGEAGITKNVTPHTLRHSFATDLLINGADLRTVQEQMNHSMITTTQRYTHVTKDRKEDSYNKHHTIL